MSCEGLHEIIDRIGRYAESKSAICTYIELVAFKEILYLFYRFNRVEDIKRAHIAVKLDVQLGSLDLTRAMRSCMSPCRTDYIFTLTSRALPISSHLALHRGKRLVVERSPCLFGQGSFAADFLYPVIS